MGRKGVGGGEESQGDKQGVETLGGKGKAQGGERSQTRGWGRCGVGTRAAPGARGPGWALLEVAAEPGAVLQPSWVPSPATGHCPHPTPSRSRCGRPGVGRSRWDALPASLGRLGRGSARCETEPRLGQPRAGWLAKLGGVGAFHWRWHLPEGRRQGHQSPGSRAGLGAASEDLRRALPSASCRCQSRSKCNRAGPPAPSVAAVLPRRRGGDPCPESPRFPGPGADPHVEPGSGAPEGGGPRADGSECRGPTRGGGPRPPGHLTFASRPASGREDRGRARAPKWLQPQRAQKRLLAFSSRSRALSPGTPRGRGQGRQNSQSFPARGSRALSRWRSRPGDVAFSSALCGWAPGWASRQFHACL